MLFVGTFDVAIFTHTQIDTQYDLLGLLKVLGNIIDEQIALSAETIINIRGVDRGTIPRGRETRMYQASAVKSIGTNTIEAFYQCTSRDVDTCREIVTLCTIHHIILTSLSEVGRTIGIVHLVNDVGFHQAEGFFIATSLEVSQCCMHHCCRRDIIHILGIGHPVAGGKGGES